jgi:hypothetical protein
MTALDSMIAAKEATDPQGALIDLIDLRKYAGDSLTSMGWNAEQPIVDMVAALDGTPQLAAVQGLFSLEAANDGVFEMRRVG